MDGKRRVVTASPSNNEFLTIEEIKADEIERAT
jgi:hypothetical protein